MLSAYFRGISSDNQPVCAGNTSSMGYRASIPREESTGHHSGTARRSSVGVLAVVAESVIQPIGLRSRSTNSRLRIFPEGDFGICSMNSTLRIFLKGATLPAT